MGTAAYNLVIVRGASENLREFETKAHKTECQAFCMEQLLPLPDYLTLKGEMSDEVQAFRHLIYGSKWVAAFGILIEKNDTSLKYYFNSKYTKAELGFIAQKYNKLNFTQVFVEITEERCGVIEYVFGKCVSNITINENKIEFSIASDINTLLYLEDLFVKIMFIKQSNPAVLEEIMKSWSDNNYSFFSLFDKTEFLKEHETFYESLYDIELNLENRDLDYARNGTAYPFITNELEQKKNFIEENFLDSEKKTFLLNILNGKTNKQEKDIVWWNKLDEIWKEVFISNLLQSTKYKDKGFSSDEIFELIKESYKIIFDIVNLKKLDIPPEVLSDLTPIFYLKNIEEFHISEPEYLNPNAEHILGMYPKELRSKVKSLNVDAIRLGEFPNSGDFTIFEDFINLESLDIQCCHFKSLNGIQKLKKLTYLMGGQDNQFSDLSPLRGLAITHLDLEFTQVTNLNPLIDLPNLVYLNLTYLFNITDFSVLLHLPNLRSVTFPDFVEINSAAELKNYLREQYNIDENGLIDNSLEIELNEVVPKNLSYPANDKEEISVEWGEQTDDLPF